VRTEAKVIRPGAVEVLISSPPIEAPPDLEPVIQRLWEEERSVRPSIVNGSIVCFRAIDADRIDACLAEYRLFVARERDQDVRGRLELRAIGVSGIVVLPSGEVMVARRSADVTEYPGAWELAPSGSVPASMVAEDGRVDTLAALLMELEEETGIDRRGVASTKALGLVWDSSQDGFDVCYELRLADGMLPSAFSGTEYRDLQALTAPEAARLFKTTDQAVPTSRAVMELWQQQ
jgi:8-oxo-dGTP pyrophosphatase MutT (NUDIX family)